MNVFFSVFLFVFFLIPNVLLKASHKNLSPDKDSDDDPNLQFMEFDNWIWPYLITLCVRSG